MAKARKADSSARIVDAALAVAARQGWRNASLADIAAEAKLPLLSVYDRFRSKGEILDAFRQRIDEAVLGGIEEDEGERPRDRLFDALMRRFDALQPHKDAVRALARELPADPLLALGALPGAARSMAWMLEASGIDASGLRGFARVHLLTGIYSSVLRVWLVDESADMMKTMAVLDRRLRAIERWLGMVEMPRAAE
jgi:AcrR family transcriptional regulator